MLSSRDKFNLLRNYKALDYICFGKPIEEVAKVEGVDRTLVSQYITTKGGLISVVIEMTKMCETKTGDEELDPKTLVNESKKVAASSITAGIHVLKTKKAREYIKEQVLSSSKDDKADVDKAIDLKLAEAALSFSIDSLLIGTVLAEATSFSKINDWEGVIVENTYKVLRNDLLSIVQKIKSGLK